jgi:hypothetical protein
MLWFSPVPKTNHVNRRSHTSFPTELSLFHFDVSIAAMTSGVTYWKAHHSLFQYSVFLPKNKLFIQAQSCKQVISIYDFYLPEYKMILHVRHLTLTNLQFSGKYLNRTYVTLCFIVRQPCIFHTIN